MNGEEPPGPPRFGEGGHEPQEVDAEELLAASNRAIAAARREAARLFAARTDPQAEPSECAEGGQGDNQ